MINSRIFRLIYDSRCGMITSERSKRFFRFKLCALRHGKSGVNMNDNIKYSSFENKFEVIHRNEKPTRLMPPHTHNAIEIYLSISSLPNMLLGSNVMPLEGNTLLIIPSYCVHQFTQSMDCEYERYIITVSTSWLEGFISENPRYKYLTDTKNPTITAPDAAQVKMLTERIGDFSKCGEGDAFAEMSVFFDILKIIDSLAHTAKLSESRIIRERVTGARKTVKEIIEYIDAHLTENIRLGDISRQFYLTPNHISRIFKQYTNTQISNYITLQRITMAKKLFRNGASVSEAQISTGYASYEHFFRTFKKHVGITPGEYRDRYCI